MSDEEPKPTIRQVLEEIMPEAKKAYPENVKQRVFHNIPLPYYPESLTLEDQILAAADLQDLLDELVMSLGDQQLLGISVSWLNNPIGAGYHIRATCLDRQPTQEERASQILVRLNRKSPSVGSTFLRTSVGPEWKAKE